MCVRRAHCKAFLRATGKHKSASNRGNEPVMRYTSPKRMSVSSVGGAAEPTATTAIVYGIKLAGVRGSTWRHAPFADALGVAVNDATKSPPRCNRPDSVVERIFTATMAQRTCRVTFTVVVPVGAHPKMAVSLESRCSTMEDPKTVETRVSGTRNPASTQTVALSSDALATINPGEGELTTNV